MTATVVDILKEGTRIDSYLGGVKISKACCSSVILVRHASEHILVDTGAMGYWREILSRLSALGLKPSDVSYIVNTHTHLDHVYNNYLFPRALVYTPTSVWHPQEEGNRVEMYPDMTRVRIPLVKILNTPGHMENHISVLAESSGKRIVVAGDAVRESIIEDGKIPGKYNHAGDYTASMKKIFSLADEIIPGHGPVITGEKLARLKAKVMGFPNNF